MFLSPIGSSVLLLIMLVVLYLLRHFIALPRNTLPRACATAIVILPFVLIAGLLVKHPKPSGWSLDAPMFLKGARIIDAWTSPSYTPFDLDLFAKEMSNPHVEQLVRNSHGPTSTPEIGIGLYTDPRALWFFAGQRATFTVALPDSVRIESIRLRGHPARPCLPRDVNVWGLVSRSTTYNIELTMLDWPSTGFPAALQTRPDFGVGRLRRAFMGSHPVWLPLAQLRDVPRAHSGVDYPVEDVIAVRGIAVHAISLEFRRNWGHDYTCFAGLGIAGNVV